MREVSNAAKATLFALALKAKLRIPEPRLAELERFVVANPTLFSRLLENTDRQTGSGNGQNDRGIPMFGSSLRRG
jgi:hypothetical protein